MTYQRCQRYRTDQGKTHTFDHRSGWCLHGCGARDDGRATNRVSGTIYAEGPTYTDRELTELATRLEHR